MAPSRLPPPSPAPEAPPAPPNLLSPLQVVAQNWLMMVTKVMVTLNQQESADPGTPSVAAAIKDIKKAIQVNALSQKSIQVKYPYLKRLSVSKNFDLHLENLSAKALHLTGG